LPSAFNFSSSPFDCLSNEERQLVRDHLDIAYFREGDAVLEPGVAPTHLFVIIKGFVRQLDEGEELVATYGPEDSFDGRALVAGKVSSRFVAAEEVLAYELKREAVNELISRNATFGALLFADLSNKLSALSRRSSQHETQSLTMARVGQAAVRAVQVVAGATNIISIARLFQAQHINHVLVQEPQPGGRLGLFSSTGLQTAILHGAPLDVLTVGELATYQLVSVSPEDYLFDALATMIRHKVRRVVVQQDGQIVGTLDQLDLLGFLSNHSYLITRQIQEAQSLATLQEAAQQITELISLLYRGGTQVRMIARLVQELNAQLFERAWQLIAPHELVANSCLFVMGSEGRGEQLLKTDQDNGLILRNGYLPPDNLAQICQDFSNALTTFGYPECPGRIMLSNPDWRQSAGDFGQTVRRWLLMPTAESLMALAIFMDAHAVCGDTSLLEGVRAEVFAMLMDNDALLARFAGSINAFDSASGWWNRLLALGEDDLLDLKKAGTFPLVHGVRSLALAHRISATSTVARIEALAADQRLPPDLAHALVDSLHFFMGLKLKVGLEALAAGRTPGGIAVDKLSSLDRDLLKDTLGVVKRFKGVLHQRFRLDML
jgi:CBS domain-containing protein